jgi:hypothetical protein
MLSDTISFAFVSGLTTKLCGDVYSKSVGEWGKNRVACIFDPWGGSDVSGEWEEPYLMLSELWAAATQSRAPAR